MFYIKHGSDNFTIIDCCMEEAYREEIVSELKRESAKKSIKRFISTHQMTIISMVWNNLTTRCMC